MEKQKEGPLQVDYYYVLVFYGLMVIVLIGNVLAYGSDLVALTVGVLLPVGIIVITLIVSFASYFYPLKVLSPANTSLAFYLFSGLALIFCDGNVFPLFFEYSGDSYIPSMFSLLILTMIGPKKLIESRKLYLSVSFFLSVLSLILNLFGSQSHGLSIFQFFILLLSVIFSSQRCLSVKVDFGKTIFKKYQESRKGEAPTTPLEEVLDRVQSSSERLMESYNLCDNELRARLSESIQDLKHAFVKLTTTKNVYEANIEELGKDMDLDDKKFIQQNFIVTEMVEKVENENKVAYKVEAQYCVDQLSGVLKQIGFEWNFDIFFVRDITRNCPIKFCGEFCIKRFGIGADLCLNNEILTVYLEELEGKYFQNPYHNNAHGADVMCSFLYLVTTTEIVGKMNSVEVLACILACLGHDVSHKAKTNRFLIMTRDELSVLYNDISILEMMHASTIFQLFRNTATNFLPEPFENFAWFRKIIIEMILATDMAKYFDQLGYFKTKYLNQAVTLENCETRLDMFKMLIKCSDIGHSAKKTELHEKWCGLIMDEFFAQGDLEKSLKLTVSMFCDRINTNIPKSQVGFIKNIVMPLFNSVCAILHSEKVEESCIKQLVMNVNYWQLKMNNKSLTEEHGNERTLLLVQRPGFNPRRGSMPMLIS
jgi:hypothetical protein